MKKDKITIIPVGGLGNFGMNLMFMGYGDDWIIIDAGIGFPDENIVGVDMELPDLNMIGEYRDRVQGIVITHAHEDHIGALPYVYNVCPEPVYAPPLVESLLKHKANYYNLPVPKINKVGPGTTVKFGAISVTWVPVTHSIPDTYGLIIETPAGTIVHSGDFKIDPEPLDGRVMDKKAFTKAGDKGVLALLSDSTNAEVPGHSRSEKSLVDKLVKLVDEAPGRVLFTMFASNVFRLALLNQVAEKTGRRIALVGASLENYISAAQAAGFRIPMMETLDARRLESFPDRKVMAVVTGSQGERNAALPRASRREHDFLNIHPGDTVIMSSRMIPGNEKAIYRVINDLIDQGARVLYQNNADVHVSGHGKQEELREMIQMVRPKVMIPLHGEMPFMVAHKELAEAEGVPQTLLMRSGDIVELDQDGTAEIVDKLPLEAHYVDGPVIGTADELKITEKRRVGWRGVVAIQVKVKRTSAGLNSKVDIISYAVYTDNNKLIERAEKHIEEEVDALPKDSHYNLIQDAIRSRLRSFFKRKAGKKPEILLFLEVS